MNILGRFIVHKFLFHAVNAIGILLTNILESDSCKWHEDASAALCQTGFIRNSEDRGIAYQLTSSCEKFIDDEVWSALSKPMFTLHMQFVKNYVAEHPDHDYVLLKTPFGHTHRLLHSNCHIDNLVMISAFTDPDDTSILFCTTFLRCPSSELVALKFFTPQNAYHNRLPKK